MNSDTLIGTSRPDDSPRVWSAASSECLLGTWLLGEECGGGYSGMQLQKDTAGYLIDTILGPLGEQAY